MDSDFGILVSALDSYFKFNGYKAEDLRDNPAAQENSLRNNWMTVGEALEFLPARKAWIEVHSEYKKMRKELKETRRALRTALSLWSDDYQRPKFSCRRRLQPLVRKILA